MTDFFAERNPCALFLYFIILLLMIMAEPYGPGLLMLFVVLSIDRAAVSGIKSFLKTFLGYIAVILFFMLFNVIFNHMGETPFLYINDTPLTVESLLYGAYTGVMVCGLFLWFLLFQDIFDSRKITWLIGRRLPVIGLILGMIFCYYEKFVQKVQKIQEVWKGYGIEEKEGKIKYAGIVLSVLLTVMLEDSVDTAMSMKARGYGSGKRSSYMRCPFQAMDVLLAAISLVFACLVFFPVKYKAAGQICFGLLPFCYNLGKEFQWKYYQLKM